MAGLPPRRISELGRYAGAGGYEVCYRRAMSWCVWLAGNPTPLCALSRDGAIPRTCKLKMLGSPYFFFFHYKRERGLIELGGDNILGGGERR
jgi:hypothetical protein